MTRHRYPVAALMGDYVRAGLGLVFTGGPIALVPANPWVAGVFGALAALFLAFAGSTLLRQLRTVEVDEAGIAARGPFPVRLDWAALDAVSLRYFALRRDRGWMQLGLRAGWRRLAVDSRIDGFEDIAAAAGAAAQRRNLTLSEATAANFAALGTPVGDAQPSWFEKR